MLTKSGDRRRGVHESSAYVAVDCEHRGQGLSHRLVTELLGHQTGQLFATTGNENLKRTLRTAVSFWGASFIKANAEC